MFNNKVCVKHRTNSGAKKKKLPNIQYTLLLEKVWIQLCVADCAKCMTSASVMHGCMCGMCEVWCMFHAHLVTSSINVLSIVKKIMLNVHTYSERKTGREKENWEWQMHCWEEVCGSKCLKTHHSVLCSNFPWTVLTCVQEKHQEPLPPPPPRKKLI